MDSPTQRCPLAGEILDGNVLPGDSLTVDAGLKKGEMRFDSEAVKSVGR